MKNGVCSNAPGYQLAAKEMIAEEDKVVVHGAVPGTHEGELMGTPLFSSGGRSQTTFYGMDGVQYIEKK